MEVALHQVVVDVDVKHLVGLPVAPRHGKEEDPGLGSATPCFLGSSPSSSVPPSRGLLCSSALSSLLSLPFLPRLRDPKPPRRSQILRPLGSPHKHAPASGLHTRVAANRRFLPLPVRPSSVHRGMRSLIADWIDEFETSSAHLPPARAHRNITV